MLQWHRLGNDAFVVQEILNLCIVVDGDNFKGFTCLALIIDTQLKHFVAAHRAAGRPNHTQTQAHGGEEWIAPSLN